MAVGFGSSSSMNSSDETLECESLPLSHAHLSEDGALRFCHVTHEEVASRNACCLIFIGRFACVHMSMGVHRSLLILALITPQMNG